MRVVRPLFVVAPVLAFFDGAFRTFTLEVNRRGDDRFVGAFADDVFAGAFFAEAFLTDFFGGLA